MNAITDQLAEALRALTKTAKFVNRKPHAPSELDGYVRECEKVLDAYDALASQERLSVETPAELTVAPSGDDALTRIIVLSDGGTWETFDPTQIEILEITDEGFHALSEGAEPDDLDGEAIVSRRSLTDAERGVPGVLAEHGMSSPRVGIRMEGGIVQSVFADRAVQVDVIDYDTEGSDPERLFLLDQDDGSEEACFINRYDAAVLPDEFTAIDQALAEGPADREGMKP